MKEAASVGKKTFIIDPLRLILFKISVRKGFYSVESFYNESPVFQGELPLAPVEEVSFLPLNPGKKDMSVRRKSGGVVKLIDRILMKKNIVREQQNIISSEFI